MNWNDFFAVLYIIIAIFVSRKPFKTNQNYEKNEIDNYCIITIGKYY